MSLDTTTLLIVSAVVILTTAVMFVSEAWSRDGEGVDRLWSLAFAAALTTGLSYLASTLSPSLWWANAVGNGAAVLTPFAMWNGVRAHLGRPPRLQVSLAVVGLVVLAAVVSGADGGPWAGGAVMLAGTAAGSILGGAAALTSSLRRVRAGVILASVLLAAGAFYVVRLAVYLAVGPESTAFRTYVGTEVATLVMVLLINGAAFSMVVLRSRHASDRREEARNFDPMTGARTAVSFVPRAVAELRADAEGCRPVVLLAITPEGLDQIAVAFGREYADEALVVCGEIAHMLLPQRALMGRDAMDGRAFQVLIPGVSAEEAAVWATQVRKELIDSPLAVPGSHLRLTASVGIATATTHGYDLEALCNAARDLSRGAIGQGGNRVVVAGATS